MGFGLVTEETLRYPEILATPIETLPIRYLGLPLTDRRLRIQDWQLVVEKVETRLWGWRGRLLSRGGRLVLVKVVLSANPTYSMLVFRMPAGVRRRLEGVMRSFFWRGADLARGCPCCLELGMPTSYCWWTWHSPPSACQLCPIKQMDSLSDAAVRRPGIPCAPGSLWPLNGLGRMGNISAWRFSCYYKASGDLPVGPTFFPAPARGRD